MSIIKNLGFEDIINFSDLYNTRFEGRDVQLKSKLSADASSLQQDLSNKKHINITDERVGNIYLAVKIWIAADQTPQNDEDQVKYGQYSFTGKEIKKVLPTLEYKDMIIPSLETAKVLRGFIDLKNNSPKIPDIAKKIENGDDIVKIFTQLEDKDIQNFISEMQTMIKSYDRVFLEQGLMENPNLSPIRKAIKKDASIHNYYKMINAIQGSLSNIDIMSDLHNKLNFINETKIPFLYYAD